MTTSKSKNLIEVNENGFLVGVGMEYDIDAQDAKGAQESSFVY